MKAVAYPNAAESSGSMSSRLAMSAVVLATATLFSVRAPVGADFSSMARTGASVWSDPTTCLMNPLQRARFLGRL